MSRGEGHRPTMEQVKTDFLTPEEIDVIKMRADLRRRSQELKINALNLQQPHATGAMKKGYEKINARVKKEAAGEEPENVPAEERAVQAIILESKAEAVAGTFPDLAAFHQARATKLTLLSGGDTSAGLELTKSYLTQSRDIPKASPSSLLPDAILLGVQKKLLEGKKMPSKEDVAKMASVKRNILADYALAHSEKERPDFLALIPDEARREVAVTLDEEASKVLHQAVVEKGSEEDKQRKEVRLRVYEEMKQTLQDSKQSDKKLAAALARALGRLGGDARLLLLELARDEMESERRQAEKEQDYLPHIIGVLMNKFDDWRVNDIAMQMVGDAGTPAPIARNLLFKLVKRSYVPADVGEWWQERNSANKTKKEFVEDKKLQADQQNRLVLLQKLITELGVIPSRDILEFLDDARRWKNAPLDKRVEIIRASQAEFAKAKSQNELVETLAQDDNKAMIYYLLHGGDDRFNLINNYSFEKFKEMLKLIADLRVHEKPIGMFERALEKAGLDRAKIVGIVSRLRAGHFPLENGQDTQEASFEVSENAAVKNANGELGKVLGKEQLGVILLFPLYREYLEKDGSVPASKLIAQMQTANTFSDRQRLIGEIDLAHPDFMTRAQTELQENWKALGEKMVLEMSLEQVLTSTTVPIRGEELIPRLNTKRLDLKRMKKDLLVALRGGNEKLEKIKQTLRNKKKARGGLAIGLEKQTDTKKKAKMQATIDGMDREIDDLEKQKAVATDAKTSERFAHLGKEEKAAKIERLGREIIALTEKSSSAIFTYLTLQVLGEEKLREQDIALIQEMESHLQGPFQTIADSLTYQPTGKERTEKKNQRVTLRYVDKAERLMNMVRFADSKICCFSSCNYEMRVLHDTPNKYWVASINADPLSFVISLEVPQSEALAEGQQIKTVENLGFIFGSFSIDANGNPGIMLNGIYYAPGIEDSKQVAAIMEKVDKMFEGMPLNSEAIASQHGGSVKMPKGFSNTPIELTRLRALDAGDGTPETKVYDDMATDSNLNMHKVYNSGSSGNLWHKES